MDTIRGKREFWDRLILLLASRPCAGWEDIYEEIIRREVERISPHTSSRRNEKRATPVQGNGP